MSVSSTRVQGFGPATTDHFDYPPIFQNIHGSKKTNQVRNEVNKDNVGKRWNYFRVVFPDACNSWRQLKHVLRVRGLSMSQVQQAKRYLKIPKRKRAIHF